MATAAAMLMLPMEQAWLDEMTRYAIARGANYAGQAAEDSSGINQIQRTGFITPQQTQSPPKDPLSDSWEQWTRLRPHQTLLHCPCSAG